MAATRTYGIPHMINTREIFPYNGGKCKLAIVFSEGLPDDKYDIPATYSTDSEFEQMVIEMSPLFNTRVFRYDNLGHAVEGPSDIALAARKGIVAVEGPNATKIYKDVTDIGRATEVLLELGAKADEVATKQGVLAKMVQMGISFPNLKVK